MSKEKEKISKKARVKLNKEWAEVIEPFALHGEKGGVTNPISNNVVTSYNKAKALIQAIEGMEKSARKPGHNNVLYFCHAIVTTIRLTVLLHQTDGRFNDGDLIELKPIADEIQDIESAIQAFNDSRVEDLDDKSAAHGAVETAKKLIEEHKKFKKTATKEDTEESKKERLEKEKEEEDKRKEEEQKRKEKEKEEEQKRKEKEKKEQEEEEKKRQDKDKDKVEPPKARPWDAPKWPTNSEANKFISEVYAAAEALRKGDADAQLVSSKTRNLGFMIAALLEKVSAGVPETEEGKATVAVLKESINKAFAPMQPTADHEYLKPTQGTYTAPADNKELDKVYKILSAKRDMFSKKIDRFKDKKQTFDLNLSYKALESINKCFKACEADPTQSATHLKTLDAELAMLELADQMASFGAMGNATSLQVSRHAVRAATTVAGAAVGAIAAGATMFTLSADVIALEAIKASLMNKRFELAAQQIVGLMQQTAPQFLLIIGACAAVGGVGMLLAATLSPMSEAINGIGDTAKFKTALEHLVGNVAAEVGKAAKANEVGK